MADLYDEIETTVDTDPLKLRDALYAVLAVCRNAEEMSDGQRREWCAPTPMAIRRAIAETLGVDCG